VKPYFDDGTVTIYHGRIEDVLPVLGRVADIAVTSPPYNMGLTPGGNGAGLYSHTTQHASRFTNDGYDGASDAMDPDEYEAATREWLRLSIEATTGAVWWNHRPRIWHHRAKFPFDMRFEFLDDLDVDLRQVVIWDRRLGTGTNHSHLTIRQEWVMLFARPGFRVDRAKAGMGDVWSFPPPPEKFGHPCPYPEELPARCIALSRPAVVLDPFAGVGTTLVAAKRAGVRAIGIEQSEAFCATAAERCGGDIRPADGGFAFGAAS